MSEFHDMKESTGTGKEFFFHDDEFNERAVAELGEASGEALEPEEENFKFNCEDNKYYVRAGEGQKLDLGAIAKGYALNEMSMAAYRANCTEGIISLGGNVLLLGSGQDGSGYKVGIRCPDENSNSSVVTVVLENTVLSTSGSYERFFFEEGVRYCHIIDPRTGDCSEKDLKSVTVICEDPIVADCMSTAYYVMGIDRTLDALASGEISGMAIDTSGVIYVSEDLTDRWRNAL